MGEIVKMLSLTTEPVQIMISADFRPWKNAICVGG